MSPTPVPPPPRRSNHPCAGFVAIPSLRLVPCRATTLTFGGVCLRVAFRDGLLRIERDPENFAVVSLKDQRVAYKVTLLGSVVQAEATTGEVGWRSFFAVDWEDEHGTPELTFLRPPTGIVRAYDRGQAIELGLEPVTQYEVRYADGVEALFERARDRGFVFRFTTGFAGSFWKEADGAWMLRFKGDTLSVDDDGSAAQSKFLVSRSKYTDNLLLYLQNDALVTLR